MTEEWKRRENEIKKKRKERKEKGRFRCCVGDKLEMDQTGERETSYKALACYRLYKK